MRARWLVSIALCAALTPEPATAEAQDAAPSQPAAPPAWCAPELETLPADVCHLAAPAGATETPGQPRTLVIFLHGVIQPETTWQWTQQRGIVLGAKRLGFSVIMPRGRRGIGPPGMTDWITWPTSVTAQRQVESDLLAEWSAARKLLETRSGKPFDEVFVVGFSNGAYYATSLALRGRLPADGAAVFAGGSAAPHLRKAGAATSDRAPVFLSVSTKDRTTVREARGLGDALRALRWPHRVESSAVGHAIADASLDHAIAYLRSARRAKR